MKGLFTAVLLVQMLAAAPVLAADLPPDIAPATTLFEAAFRGRCAEHAFDGRQADPERFEITYLSSSASESDPNRRAILYSFFCENFAHSGSAAYILRDDDGSYRILTFAEPTSTFGKNADGDLIATGLDGLAAWDTLNNGYFDPETKVLSTSDHVGDDEYFSSWKFVDGMFVFSENQTWRIVDGHLERQPADAQPQ